MLIAFTILTSISILNGAECEISVRMPGALPDVDDNYLCTGIDLSQEPKFYINQFVPHGNSSTAHHMLLYACSSPITYGNQIWSCGGRYGRRYQSGSTCGRVIYAWALDAPKFHLPDGVAFRVGKNTPGAYLMLQVHYLKSLTEADFHGFTLLGTTEKQPKQAGLLVLGTSGSLSPQIYNKMDIVCTIRDNIPMHPFAYRVHTHYHGTTVMGYNYRNEDWSLIGKQNPQLPQAFYPVHNKSMVIQNNDVISMRRRNVLIPYKSHGPRIASSAHVSHNVRNLLFRLYPDDPHNHGRPSTLQEVEKALRAFARFN